MLHIKHLNKTFNRNKVLKEIDATFSAGKITAILGPNGSGKTTLIKCVLGMVIPESGEIGIQGKNINNTWEYRKDIAYLSQIAHFPENLKVREIFSLLQDIRGKAPKLDTLVAKFNLAPFVDQKLSSLSGGTRQKVNLVQALMFDSPILILDEPTNGLDPITVVQLKEYIREEKTKGKTILLTSHIMQFVEGCADDLVFLLEGRVHFNGALADLLAAYRTSDLEFAIAQMLEESEGGKHLTGVQSQRSVATQNPLHQRIALS